jgi:hypothetical protein
LGPGTNSIAEEILLNSPGIITNLLCWNASFIFLYMYELVIRLILPVCTVDWFFSTSLASIFSAKSICVRTSHCLSWYALSKVEPYFLY